jgi:hypothetical protein
MSQNNVITINGKEYEESNLEPTQKYLIQHVRDLQAKAGQLRFQLEQVQVSLDHFTKELIASVEAEGEDKAESA